MEGTSIEVGAYFAFGLGRVVPMLSPRGCERDNVSPEKQTVSAAELNSHRVGNLD